MDLFDLPIKTVIEDGILPHLNWNDLLQLRSVCKRAQSLVHSYLKHHPELGPEIEITETEGAGGKGFTLRNLVDSGIPVGKLFLSGSHSSWYYEVNAETVDQFLEEYASMVTQVRVRKLTLGLGKERQFWEGLSNLNSLTAEEIKFKRYLNSKDTVGLPGPFGQLRRLNIEELSAFPNGNQFLEQFRDFLVDCKMLEYLKLPRIEGRIFPGDAMARFLNTLTTFIIVPKSNLKEIDFEETTIAKSGFRTAAQVRCLGNLGLICLSNNVNLLNVDVSWLQQAEVLQQKIHIREFIHVSKLSLGSILVSMNCHCFGLSAILSMDLPSLKEVRILSLYNCLRELEQLAGKKRSDWNKLENLTVSVTALVAGQTVREIKALLDYFLERDPYPNLKEVEINFPETDHFCYGCRSHFNMGRMVNYCSSLKKMTLKWWNGSDAALVKLCQGMSGLEEVTLVGFQKEDVSKQTFLVDSDTEDIVMFNVAKLQKRLLLRRGTLVWGDGNEVLCHLLEHIKHALFNIKSSEQSNSVKLVTCVGLRSLLGKWISQFVENNPAKEWKVQKIFATEMKTLVKMLQSTL